MPESGPVERPPEARACEKDCKNGMLPQQGWAWREGDLGFYWCTCPVGQAAKAEHEAQEAAKEKARAIATESPEAAYQRGREDQLREAVEWLDRQGAEANALSAERGRFWVVRDFLERTFGAGAEPREEKTENGD